MMYVSVILVICGATAEDFCNHNTCTCAILLHTKLGNICTLTEG